MKYRIREHRKKLGWTLERLAEEVGTSKGYLSDLETGKRTGGIDMIREIAGALSVTEMEIFTAENAEEQDMLDHIAVYQQLPPEDREAISQMAKRFLSSASSKSDSE